MGQDKALLPYRGMTLLEYVIATVLEIEQDIVVVTDHRDRYRLSFGQVIEDSYPGSGPVGGIVTGLMTLGQGTHLVTACDMPGLKSAVLHQLVKAASPDMDAVIPEIDGHLEPLCAVYRHSAMPKLMRFLEKGGMSAQEAVQTLLFKRVGEGVLRRIDPELLCFANINTPDDLRQFLARMRNAS
jgi:molybdopterin-guanine dinucleotide biosynthesis protein A